MKYRAKISPMLIKGLNLPEQNSLNYFMILECLNGNVQDVIKFISPANPIDLMGHLLSFAIHTIRLGSKRLSLLRTEEYEKLYRKCITIIDNFCRTEYINYSSLWAANNIFQAYLSPYFRLIDDEIFCVPHNQVNLTNEMLKIYDKSLCFDCDSKEAIKLNFMEKNIWYKHTITVFMILSDCSMI